MNVGGINNDTRVGLTQQYETSIEVKILYGRFRKIMLYWLTVGYVIEILVMPSIRL